MPIISSKSLYGPLLNVLSVTAAADIKMGSLARICQASYLLGHVLHYNQSRSLASPANYQQDEEYYQLDRIVRSLLNLSYVEGQIRRMNVCEQTSICYRYTQLRHTFIFPAILMFV